MTESILLAAVVGVTLLFVFALTVLPGIVLALNAFWHRLRGRPAEPPAILGPLFLYELTIVSRRAVQYRLRTLYAVVLLACMLVSYLSHFPELKLDQLFRTPDLDVPRERLTQFAEKFAVIYLYCQLIVLTVLTPVFAAGAILEEKDRKTLDYLRTSLLTNREIVLGKLVARLVFVLGLAMTGLPILSLTILFGGVSPEILICSFATTLMFTIVLAIVSFWLAIHEASLRVVLIKVYVGLIVLHIFSCCGSCVSGWVPMSFSPYFFIVMAGDSFSNPSSVLVSALTQVVGFGLLSAALSMWTTHVLRTPPVSPPVRSTEEIPPTYDSGRPRYVRIDPDRNTPAPSPPMRVRPPVRFVRIPSIGNSDPLEWKETHFGGKLPGLEADMFRSCLLAMLLALVIPIVLMLISQVASTSNLYDAMRQPFRLASQILFLVLIPFSGLRSAGCISRERQQQTLDSLFTLPLDRADFLRAKFRAARRWLTLWLWGYAAIVGLFVGSWFIHREFQSVALLCWLPLLAAEIVLLHTIAIWLSIRSQTVLRATTWYLFAYGLMLVLPIVATTVLQTVTDRTDFRNSIFEFIRVYSFPPLAMELFTFRNTWSVNSRHISVIAVAMCLFLAAAYAVVGWLLWRDAVRQFEKEGR